jgi:hypothetical protein
VAGIEEGIAFVGSGLAIGDADPARFAGLEGCGVDEVTWVVAQAELIVKVAACAGAGQDAIGAERSGLANLRDLDIEAARKVAAHLGE